MNFIRNLLCLLVAVWLTGCSFDMDSALRKVLPDEALSVSDAAVEAFLARDSDGLRSAGTSDFKTQATDEALEALYSYIGEGEVVSISLIGGKAFASSATGKSVTATYQAEMTDRFLTITTVMKNSNDRYLLTTLNIKAAEQSYSEQVKFSLEGKTPVQYLFFALTIFVPLFIITTFVFCIRRRGMKRKILWCIFVLIGVPTITLNWSTGAVSASGLEFQLLGAGFLVTDALYFSVGLPLGAIIWWFRYGLKADKPSAD